MTEDIKTLVHPQLYPPRREWMMKLARRCGEENCSLHMLEVGSWVGESAILWASSCGIADCKVLCLDAWKPYKSAPGAMNEALVNEDVRAVFDANVRLAGLEGVICSAKVDAPSIAWALGEFDLIYLDGDHSYNAILSDLRTFAPHVRYGGYFCGDDLEYQFGDTDIVEPDIRANSHLDGYKGGHPGVTVAVNEFFGGRVSSYNGFWVMQKILDGWEAVSL